MLLEKKNIICIEVDRFKTEIVRASRGFITGPLPKLLHKTLGLKDVKGHPDPKLNWSVRHLRSLVVFLKLNGKWDWSAEVPLYFLSQLFIWNMKMNIEMLRDNCFLF